MADITGNKTENSSFLDVLLSLKKNINRNLNCSKVVIVNEIDNKSIRCTILGTDVKIICTKLKNIEVAINDAALVLFTDIDFRTNMNRLSNNENTQQINSTTFHSLNYGIIIGTLDIKGEENVTE